MKKKKKPSLKKRDEDSDLPLLTKSSKNDDDYVYDESDSDNEDLASVAKKHGRSLSPTKKTESIDAEDEINPNDRLKCCLKLQKTNLYQRISNSKACLKIIEWYTGLYAGSPLLVLGILNLFFIP